MKKKVLKVKIDGLDESIKDWERVSELSKQITSILKRIKNRRFRLVQEPPE